MTSTTTQHTTPNKENTVSLFAQHTTGGAWFNAAEVNGHLVIITNVAANWPREYDEKRKGEVDIATFAVADLNGTGEWTTVRSSYNGINNKLGNIRGQAGMVLGRIGTVKTTGGFDAWVLAEYTPEDEAYAVQWLASHPAPSAFAAQSAPPQAAAPAPAALPSLPQAGPAPAAPVSTPPPVVAAMQAAPAPAPAAAPALDPAQIAAMMAALQGQPAGQQ